VTLATAATATSPAGAYAITASDAADHDYDITFISGTLTVTAAPLTISADNKSMTYGGSVPALTVSYAGFVNGDTFASLTAPASLTTAATSTSSVGDYTIAASGATSPTTTSTSWAAHSRLARPRCRQRPPTRRASTAHRTGVCGNAPRSPER